MIGTKEEKAMIKEYAYQLFLESNGTITSNKIAEAVNMSPSTVRNWKRDDKWMQRLANDLQIREQELRERAATEHGKLGGAPKGNNNAVLTGEFDQILFDSMDADQVQMINMLKGAAIKPKNVLVKQLQILYVRERDMLQRLSKYKDKKFVELTSETIDKSEGKEGELREKKKKLIRVDELIVRQEEALTRVQKEIIATAKAIEKINLDTKYFNLAKLKGEPPEPDENEIPTFVNDVPLEDPEDE